MGFFLISEGDEALPASDPDADGLNNLLEYALRTHPTEASPSIIPVTDASGNLTLSFTRNTDATDVTLIVQASSDLAGAWEILATSTGGAPFQADQPGITVNEPGSGSQRQVQVGEPSPSAPSPSATRRYLRVRVSSQ
jgi:hypothetical protein